jgi:hypothetical protein
MDKEVRSGIDGEERGGRRREGGRIEEKSVTPRLEVDENT